MVVAVSRWDRRREESLGRVRRRSSLERDARGSLFLKEPGVL